MAGAPAKEVVRVTVWQAIVLGIVQGLGEFLPISSSAHLYLVPWLLGWPEQSLAFDVALHMGTLLAVVLVFWEDLLGMARAALRDGLRTREGRLGWAVAAATVPGGLSGLFLEELVKTVFRSPLVMAFNLAVVGVALWAVDRAASKRKGPEQTGFTDVLYMGIAQALAVVPGVSRSGITMTAGLVRGLDRRAAARVSFLLSFPLILGAGVYELKDLTAADLTLPFWAGVASAGLVGFLVIRFLLNYLARGTFAVFAIYRVVLAGVVAAVALLDGG